MRNAQGPCKRNPSPRYKTHCLALNTLVPSLLPLSKAVLEVPSREGLYLHCRGRPDVLNRFKTSPFMVVSFWGGAGSHTVPDPVSQVDEGTPACVYLTEVYVNTLFVAHALWLTLRHTFSQPQLTTNRLHPTSWNLPMRSLRLNAPPPESKVPAFPWDGTQQRHSPHSIFYHTS